MTKIEIPALHPKRKRALQLAFLSAAALCAVAAALLLLWPAAWGRWIGGSLFGLAGLYYFVLSFRLGRGHFVAVTDEGVEATQLPPFGKAFIGRGNLQSVRFEAARAQGTPQLMIRGTGRRRLIAVWYGMTPDQQREVYAALASALREHGYPARVWFGDE